MKNSQSSYKWMSLAAAGLIAVALAGCGSSGGGGGGGGDTTPPPPSGGGGAAPAVAVPAGTAPITLTAATPAATFATLTPAVTVGGVSISSPPQVSFAVTDGNSNAIIGLGSKSQSATATLASYPNIAFALAKLVPGTNGAPSKWVSYIVTTVPTYKSATDKTVVAATATRPSTDNTGTLMDNKNGTYTYTFYRDITKVADQVAAMTLTAPNSAADLGDLTYQPNLVHRLTIAISGNAPGTGTNTPDGVQVTAAVPMAKPANVIYDFIPATGKPVTASDFSRDIVATAKCNECHDILGNIPGSAQAFHGGSRNDARYCVVCHTEQRKFGQAEATTTATGYTGNTYRTDGIAVGNFPRQIHKIHFGTELTKTGYNYGGVLFNEVTYSQDHRNCTKCHDGSDTSTAKTKDGDNWKKVPSVLACGACHDGINFATGKGKALATDFAGHIGGAQPDDSKCALCHDATSVDTVYHLPVTPPNTGSALHVTGGNANTNAAWIASNTARLPAGAIKVAYDVNSVSRNASKQPVMVFRILQNGVAVPFNNSAASTEMWNNFMGSPSAYFVFAVPQDGIAAPADFNASASGYLKTIWNGTATGTGKGTLTGPDANGFYTVTLTGVTIPDNAVMLTGGLGYTYNVTSTLPLTQTNLPDYPLTAALATGQTNKIGGLIVAAPNVQKVATGYTGRRVIVDDARCDNCHQLLGPFTAEAFHAGQRNNGTTCAWCHTPNRTSSGWSVDSTYFIHAIHAATKRGTPFTYDAVSLTDSFANVTYPGILKDCQQCHVPGGYDFSNGDTSSAIPNRLYRTVATGVFNGTATADPLAKFRLSPYVVADNVTNYGTGFSFAAATGTSTAAAGTTLVNSPIAAVCFACHDSTLAMQHMESNGGSLNDPRSTALAKTEQCTLCHTSGKVADIKLMHAK